MGENLEPTSAVASGVTGREFESPRAQQILPESARQQNDSYNPPIGTTSIESPPV
jgi:hypothetical protein